METKHYRLVPPPQGIQFASDFADRIYAEVAAEKPDHPSCFEGEWVCDHTLCPVRAVRLRVKAFHHLHLPQLRCPLCLRTLVFRHWLNIIALQEVPAEPTKKRSRAPGTKRGGPRKRPLPPGTSPAPSV